MPSRGLSVDTEDRNDVLSFWHAIYQASEGYEERPVFKESSVIGFYSPDFTIPYSYIYDALVLPPILTKLNGVPASGELSLGFVKDVERRVNFYRALVGAPASVALMDSDTQKSSAIVNLGVAAPYQPPASTLKADAAQKSAYLIARTYQQKYGAGTHTWGMYHNLSASRIPGVVAWNKEAWNGNYNSNLSLGFFGPSAIDRYMTEEVENSEANENLSVGHRRGVLALGATQFATGDVPGNYSPFTIDGPGNPQVRPSTNALYVLQRTAETATVTPRFVSYPSPGFFPAKMNSPYWSLHHPQANFTGATVTMTDASGTSIPVGTPVVKTDSTSTVVNTLSWPISAAAGVRNISTDQTFRVTVSNFTVAGVATSRTYSVTLINPDRIDTHPTLIGSAAPPAGGSATYFFTPLDEAEAVQVNAFQEVPGSWVENADSASKVISDVKGNYPFLSSAYPVSGAQAFHLTHGARYDLMTNGVPEESFIIDREILPAAAGTSRLKFSYRRAYMTFSSSMAIEKSADDGASWTTLGVITGAGTDTVANLDSAAILADLPLGTSSTPLKVRFRFYKSGTGKTYNQQDSVAIQTGIFIDNIFTTNTTSYELKRTNDLPRTADRFTLNASTAGLALTAGQPLHLRFRSKLGGHWFQYGPAKVITPTATPIPGFSGWTSYDYPILSGGFTGDHDGDGIPNAIEFAFYEDPLKPGATSDVVALGKPPTEFPSTKAIPPDSLIISRSIPELRDGIDYDAEWSDTLAPNSWTNVGVTILYQDGKVIAHVPKGPGKRFIRWKISDP